MSEEKAFHMSRDEFRELGHKVVDWIADYQGRVEDLPVLSGVAPGDIRRLLSPSPPQQGESLGQLIEELERVVLPGITHWQSPNFFAYFPANTSGPSVLGELLSAGLGVQGMLWVTSPACTELETHVLDWLVEMMGLPDAFLSGSSGGGVIQDTASSAILCAILAARERATAGASNAKGCDGRLTAYVSSESHSSVEKGIRIAGIGSQQLRTVAVDDTMAMRPDLLEDQIEADRAAGYTPFFVCATVGTTSSHAMDPLLEIGEVCKRQEVWLHVDAAMAGSAAVCPEHRLLFEGLELADSYCFNPHKWLFTNFDCSCFWVADRAALIGALSIMPEFLRNQASEAGGVLDYRDWQVPLGRRFRALKLWLVIRHYGIEGLRHHLRQHITWAQELRAWIEEDERFELTAPTPLNLVCFRLCGADEINQRLVDELNRSGALYLSTTRIHDRLSLRLCVGQTHTERRHVVSAWSRIQAAAATA